MVATVDAEAMVVTMVAMAMKTNPRQTQNKLARIGRKVINTEKGRSC
ncbi:MAG: hypothetical protein Q7T78_07735 [Rhodoferax sp.]|nr:hypothetical protein [Rhodoferax sp.]